MNALILAFASYCARETIGRLCALPRGALRRDTWEVSLGLIWSNFECL
jgi:hypothetical protein